MYKNEAISTTLTLTRKKQFMEANIPIDIIVNGYLACQLKNGETRTINIHSHDIILLQADMLRNRTQATKIDEQERDENLYKISHVISNPVYIAGVVLAILSTILIFTTGHLAFMALVLPPAAILLYYKFIRRDQYLRISKIKKQKMMYRPSEN